MFACHLSLLSLLSLLFRAWRAAAPLVVAACALLLAGGSAQATERALLVGVSHYPHLSGRNLEGPPNDLRLMHALLQRLQVPPEQVLELSEAAGPEHWPTRARILAALDELAARSRAGDRAIVYFSGHGTRTPQTPATRRAYPEPDGLDQAFLPRDTRRWLPERQQVEGAILDDEFGAAFDKLRARGVTVWAIFDTCHAADMTRGGSPGDAAQASAVWRYVPPAELGVPEPQALAAQPRRFGSLALAPRTPLLLYLTVPL